MVARTIRIRKERPAEESVHKAHLNGNLAGPFLQSAPTMPRSADGPTLLILQGRNLDHQYNHFLGFSIPFPRGGFRRDLIRGRPDHSCGELFVHSIIEGDPSGGPEVGSGEMGGNETDHIDKLFAVPMRRRKGLASVRHNDRKMPPFR